MGESRLQIDYKYYRNFSKQHNRRLFCYVSRGGSSSRYRTGTDDYSKLDLEELFRVPGGLKKFLESQNGVKKYQFLEAFISFLLQLLHPETYKLHLPAKQFEDQVENLERELRILLTVLGDSSLLLCDDEHDEFHKLWAEFEAVTTEAATLACSLVCPFDHSLFCLSTDLPDPAKLGADFDVVLNLLKTNVMKSLNLLSSNNKSAYVTPNTSAVNSLLIVDSLIYDLEDLLNREDNPIADVNDEIKRLHQWLIVLQSSIKDTDSPQPSEIGELKEFLMRIGDMAYAAEYLIISFLIGDAPLWYLVPRLIDINGKIELIGTELLEITKKYKSGGLKVASSSSRIPLAGRTVLDNPMSLSIKEDSSLGKKRKRFFHRIALKVAEYFSCLALPAKGNIDVDDVIVGFEDNARDILDQLVGRTERLQVILIFGMPGIGKTTLAKKLYNHPSVSYWFDKLSWCVVSQNYQRKSMLTNILVHINNELDKHKILSMVEESLVEHIYKTLKGRRYLIVMDDIWDSNIWDDLHRCFPDDRNGSRILFTSRDKDVAPPNSIIYAQPPLSKDQCWELLEKKVFHNKPCPPKLLGIGKEIAANCCGLPLAVAVIAGILSNMDRERNAWEEVGGNLASYIFYGGENSAVMQILELSYKHLPDHLKPCFLYFGAFEEDKEIPARKLMRLWIAEGFIRMEEEKSPDDVAEEYLRELIDKSLVMVAETRSDGGVKSCVTHDLLRDLCLRMCEEDNFLKFEIRNSMSSYESRPASNHRKSATWSYCQHMRSFGGSWRTSRLYVRDMRLLRILDSEFYINELIGIEYLVNLRYLVISDDLLASISGLVNLEYLSVKLKTWDTVYLPPAIVKMRKLRYIHFRNRAAKYDKDCNSSETNNLEFLAGITITEPKDEEMLRCSPHLRKLKCTYYWGLMEKKAYPHIDLRFLTQLDSLNLRFDHYRRFTRLEEFGLPSKVRKLTLSLSRLRWEKMAAIGRLENLEVLKLEANAFEGERWDTRDGEFQKLKFLKLDGIDHTEWNVASSQHFPKLQRLILNCCCYLQEIPSEIGEIPTLQLIEVKGRCRKSLVESAQGIQQEQCEDMGNEELRVIINITHYTP